jgi:predicted GNAT family N-acyltransferase
LEILIKSWKDAEADAYSVRQEVFIREQKVPAELELDEFDLSAAHALAYQGSRCIGTGRLVDLGAGRFQIGRMAVLAPFRNQAVGRQILESLVHLARSQEAGSIVLHSQVSAIPFYEKLGFQVQGPTYDEAGIAHRNMILLLPN